MSEDTPRYGATIDTSQARTDELRALLAALGFSQREAAESIEVDVRTLRYWAANNPAPPISALYAFRYLVLERAALRVIASSDSKMRDGDFARGELAATLDEMGVRDQAGDVGQWATRGREYRQRDSQ